MTQTQAKAKAKAKKMSLETEMEMEIWSLSSSWGNEVGVRVVAGVVVVSVLVTAAAVVPIC